MQHGSGEAETRGNLRLSPAGACMARVDWVPARIAEPMARRHESGTILGIHGTYVASFEINSPDPMAMNLDSPSGPDPVTTTSNGAMHEQ